MSECSIESQKLKDANGLTEKLQNIRELKIKHEQNAKNQEKLILCIWFCFGFISFHFKTNESNNKNNKCKNSLALGVPV